MNTKLLMWIQGRKGTNVYGLVHLALPDIQTTAELENPLCQIKQYVKRACTHVY